MGKFLKLKIPKRISAENVLDSVAHKVLRSVDDFKVGDLMQQIMPKLCYVLKILRCKFGFSASSKDVVALC
jgi:hypothetical protein